MEDAGRGHSWAITSARLGRLPGFVGFVRVSHSPSALIFARIGSTVIAFATAPIIARALGPAGRGETAAVLALVLIVPIVIGIGIPLDVRRLSAQGYGDSALRSARLWCLFTLPACCALALVLWYTVFRGFDESARWLAAITVVLMPLSLSWILDTNLLVARKRYRAVALILIVQPLVYLFSILLAWVSIGLTPAIVIGANLAGTVFATMSGLLLARVGARGGRAPLRQMVTGGGKYAGSAIAEAASNRLDQVLALQVIGVAQAGFYSVAVTISAVPVVLGQALGATYFARVAVLEDASEKSRIRHEAVRRASALAIMSLAPTLVAVYVGIPIVFGAEFREAVIPGLICSVATAVRIIAYVLSLTMAAEGRGTQMTIAQLVSLAFGIGGLFWIGKEFGAIGASVASLVSMVVLAFALAVAAPVSASAIFPGRQDYLKSIRQLIRSGS